MNEEILNYLKKCYCSDLEIEERSVDRYMIHTGYTYPDGDELHIVLEKNDGHWSFTDDGHTAMWLSYLDFELNSARRNLMQKTLNSNCVSFDEGMLYVKIEDKEYSHIGAYLRLMIQAEIQVADLLFLEKDWLNAKVCGSER